MAKIKSIRRLAMAWALLAATQQSPANETHQVISENGETNIVERIDFPAGQIKDVIPAGDKYIIHADPIDSLKNSVAKDALFVMEKSNPNAAFGRTFSTPIHSVAYVPGLDIAVWSYESAYSTNLLEVAQGQSALKAAASNSGFVTTNRQRRFYPEASLFASTANTVWEIGPNDSKQHVLNFDQQGYQENLVGGHVNSLSSDGLVAGDQHSTFALRSVSNPTMLTHNIFDGASQMHTIPDMGKPISMAAVATDSKGDGYLLFGYENGEIKSAHHSSEIIDDFNESIHAFSGPVTSMTGTDHGSVLAVSATNPTMVEMEPNLDGRREIMPNQNETGYRKVISDGNEALLLSNTASNYFYRVYRAR